MYINNNTISNVIFAKNDTCICNGTYNEKKCIVKIVNHTEDGINAKVIREVVYLKKYSDKNVVKLYDVFVDDNKTYIFLEKGQYNLLEESIEDKETCINDVIRGISSVHENGYVHCDLSLGNIVKFDDCYKIIDFGSCIKNHRINAVFESTYYISPPEKFINNNNNINISKIDSWSLGCIIYYIKTNKYYVPPMPKKETHEHLINNNIDCTDESLQKILIYDNKKRNSVIYFAKQFNIFNDANNVKKKQVTKNIKLFNSKICSKEINNHDAIIMKLNKYLINLTSVLNTDLETLFIVNTLMKKIKSCSDHDFIFTGFTLYFTILKLTTIYVYNAKTLSSVFKKISGYTFAVNDILKKTINILKYFDWDVDVYTPYEKFIKYSKNKHINIFYSFCLSLNSRYRTNDIIEIVQRKYMHKNKNIISEATNNLKKTNNFELLRKYFIEKHSVDISNFEL